MIICARGCRVSPAGTGSHHRSRRNSRLNISGGRPAGPRTSRVGEGVHRVDRARLYRRYAPVIDPAAGSQLGQHRVPGRPDLAHGQQAAEEQVTVVRQAPSKPVGVIHQMRGIGQLIHTPTVSSGR
jgi:hypothetical protein